AGVRGEAPARPRWWRGTGCAGRRHPRCRSPPPGGGTERGGGRDRAPDRRPTAGQSVGRWLRARRDCGRADAPRAGRAGGDDVTTVLALLGIAVLFAPIPAA